MVELLDKGPRGLGNFSVIVEQAGFRVHLARYGDLHGKGVAVEAAARVAIGKYCNGLCCSEIELACEGDFHLFVPLGNGNTDWNGLPV